MPRIPVTAHISIDADEIEERFVRASGPGGQNLNKVSSAVELRFDVRNSPSLPGTVAAKLERLAGARLTSDGVIVIQAQEYRDQPRNREAALQRLVELIREATFVPKKRKPTKATYASKVRRLEGKAKRSGVKAGRGKPRLD
nr:alternative ribosome rescue aminoacyl-tRNA hydrolase ArfB [Sphingomonas sp. Y57]